MEKYLTSNGIKAQICVMSHLSDVQMEMGFAQEQAQLRINFVKWVILKLNGNLNQSVDIDLMWEDFKVEQGI